MTTCDNCGSRVYALGCVNCDEAAYIDEQARDEFADQRVTYSEPRPDDAPRFSDVVPTKAQS